MELATDIMAISEWLMFGGGFMAGATTYFKFRFNYSFIELKYDYLFSFGLIAASFVLG